MHVAGGESSRLREAGAGKRTPRGPGDPALEATQRAGWELPTRQTLAGKEGRQQDPLAHRRRWIAQTNEYTLGLTHTRTRRHLCHRSPANSQSAYYRGRLLPLCLSLSHEHTLFEEHVQSMWAARRVGIKEFTEHYNFLSPSFPLSLSLAACISLITIVHLDRFKSDHIERLASRLVCSVYQKINSVSKCVLNRCGIDLICACVCVLSPVKRAPNSHNRHQPPYDGHVRRTFHEASGCFVSPARD